MSWLRQFVNHNRDFAGNLLKNAAPAAFLIPGIGPGMAAGIGALGSAVGRGIQHGGNFGNIAKQGLQGGAMAYGGAQGMQALRGAFAPSSSLATTAATPAGGVNPALISNGNGGWLSAGGQAGASAADSAGGAGSLMDKLGGAAHAFGSFAKENPNAMAMGLQGLGQIGTMGTENAYRRAQTNAVNQQTAMSQQEQEMLKRRQAALEPLMRALMGQQYAPAHNPYTG